MTDKGLCDLDSVSGKGRVCRLIQSTEETKDPVKCKYAISTFLTRLQNF